MSTATVSPAGVRNVKLLIGGRFEDAASGRTFDSINPATGEVVARVAEAAVEDVDRAAHAARRSFDSGVWSRRPDAERRAVMHAIADRMESELMDLARLESVDNGKPVRESSTGDIPRAIANFRLFADYLTTLGTECYPMDHAAIQYVLREPVGVAGLITPWNFPLLTLAMKLAPALSVGNSIVAKPAEWTPMTAARLAEIALEAGVPEGVLNMVHGFGPDAAGEAVTRHPEVNAISFTGESATGSAIMAAASRTLKRVSFELGGKGSTIVFADADFDEAIGVAFNAAFKNSGQVCTAGSRLLIEARVYDRFVSELVRRAQAIRIGDPMDPATEQGPLVHAEHRARVQGYLDWASANGVRILCGGRTPAGFGPNYVEPTVIESLDAQARVCQEEIFGPVVTVTPFQTEDEAVRISNSTRYGLSAAVCTGDVHRAHRIVQRLEAGTVWVNTWSLRDSRVPFGGYKQSGVGREGGLHAIDFFTESKTVCVKI